MVSCHHVGAKTWPHPTTCRVQCWDASGQMTKRVGPQPHPSADCLPKVVLGVQQPLNTPLDSRGTRLTSTHSGQAPVSPTRKPGQASGLTSTTRGQTPEARELWKKTQMSITLGFFLTISFPCHSSAAQEMVNVFRHTQPRGG